jgi:hypothetical protein
MPKEEIQRSNNKDVALRTVKPLIPTYPKDLCRRPEAEIILGEAGLAGLACLSRTPTKSRV